MNNRLEYIDSLRGIAATLVMIVHYYLLCLKYNPEYSVFVKSLIFGILDFGKLGVVVFFAISGFVIPFSLYNYNIQPIKKFIISRFFRLYPIYWFSIICAVLLNMADKLDVITIISNLSMLQKFIGKSDVLGVYWTLQIELIFYFLVIILFIVKKLQNIKFIKNMVYIFLIVSLIMAIIRNYLLVKLPVALFLALSVMFIGYLWRLAIIEKAVERKNVINLIYLFIISLLPICFFAYNKDFGFQETWYRYFLSYSLSIIIFLVGTTKVKIHNKITSYIGKISYSVYLLHPIVYFLVLNPLFQSNLYKYTGEFGIGILSICITYILSIFTYKFIELRFIKIGKEKIESIG